MVLMGVIVVIVGILFALTLSDSATLPETENQRSVAMESFDSTNDALKFQTPSSVVEPEQQIGERPFDESLLFTNPLTGEFASSSLTQNFDENIDLARAGNADSMLVIANTIRGCYVVGSFSSEEEFLSSDLVQSRQLPDFYREAIIPLIIPCSHVNKHKPEDALNYFRWAFDWYRKSAEAGNVLAKLYLLQGKEDSDSVKERSELLTEAVSASGYHAYYLAAYYFGALNDDQKDPRNLVGTAWYYTACINHPECNDSEYLKSLEKDLYPRDLSDIQSLSERLQNQIKQGDAISFSPRLTIYEMLDGGS